MTKNYKIYSLVNFKRICFILRVFFIWKLCKIICTKSQVTIAENWNWNDDLTLFKPIISE